MGRWIDTWMDRRGGGMSGWIDRWLDKEKMDGWTHIFRIERLFWFSMYITET